MSLVRGASASRACCWEAASGSADENVKRRADEAHYRGVSTISSDTDHAADSLDRLLRRYLIDGSEEAMEGIVRRTRPRLLAVARRIGAPQDAEDSVQSAYVSLVRLRGRPLEAPVLAWLVTAVVRIAYRRKALSRREEQLAERLARPRDAGTPDTAAVRAEERTILKQSVARLPALYRDPVVLHDLQGLTTSETARLLGLAEPTVRTRLHRARAILRASGTRRLLWSLWIVPWCVADSACAATAAITVGALMNAKTAILGLLVIAAIGAGVIYASRSPDKPQRTVASQGTSSSSGTSKPVSPPEPPVPVHEPEAQEAGTPPATTAAPPKLDVESPMPEPRPLFDPARLTGKEFLEDFGFQLELLEGIVERHAFIWTLETKPGFRVGGGEVPLTVRAGDLRASIGPEGEDISIHYEATTVGEAQPDRYRMEIGRRRSDARMRGISSPGEIAGVLRNWEDAVSVTYEFEVSEDERGQRPLAALTARTDAWLDPELVRLCPFARQPFEPKSFAILRAGGFERPLASERRREVDEATWQRLERVFERFTIGAPR